MRRTFWLGAIGVATACVVWLGLASVNEVDPPAGPAHDTALQNAKAGVERREIIDASPEKPAAMHDLQRYAAARLAEIKANPQPWQDAWTWRREYSAANTGELQREVVGLARQVGPEALLALLPQALAASDDAVRLDAVRSIALLPENKVADGFAFGVVAPDSETRSEVMGLIDEAQPHLRPELLRISLVAGPSDIQARAIEMVSDRPNPEYFAVLIEGLRTTFGETRQAVEESIATLVGESLTDYDAATRWWSENRGRFDGMLARIE